MSSISSEIKWRSFAAKGTAPEKEAEEGSSKYYLRVEGINVNAFEREVIDEFRRDLSMRGQSISSFEIQFASDGVDGGEIWVDKEKRQYLEEFQNFIRKNRPEFEFRRLPRGMREPPAAAAVRNSHRALRVPVDCFPGPVKGLPRGAS